MKNRIAASLLMFCLAGAASAQTMDAQPEQTKQTRRSRSEAKKRAAQQSAKSEPMADQDQTTAMAKPACAATEAAGQTQMDAQSKKTEGDPTASQNVVEYGGGGF